LAISGCLLLAVTILTCSNVFLRMFGRPIPGTFELMGYLSAVLTAFALGYTQVRRGHIAVDVLVLRFPKRMRNFLNMINYFICMIFFGFVAWQIAEYAATLRQTGELSETLRIIYYPFTYGVALGCFVLSLVFLVDFLKSILKRRNEETGK